MGSQELQGVDLKKHPVEEQVMCRRPPAGIQEEAAQDEFLGGGGEMVTDRNASLPSKTGSSALHRDSLRGDLHKMGCGMLIRSI